MMILCDFGPGGAVIEASRDYYNYKKPETRKVGRYVILDGWASVPRSFHLAGLKRAILKSVDGKFYWHYHPKRFMNTPLSEKEESVVSLILLGGENW